MAIDQQRILEDTRKKQNINFGSLLRSQATIEDPMAYMSKIDDQRQQEQLLGQLEASPQEASLHYSPERIKNPTPASFEYSDPLNASYKMTQKFGNYNPGLYSGVTNDSRHKGVDFATPVGTQVHSPIGGKVEVGFDKNWGKYALLHGDDGVTYRFSHLSDTPVKPGRINAGQMIGLTGSTGNSTGPHLDISAQVNGKFVDPLGLDAFRRLL